MEAPLDEGPAAFLFGYSPITTNDMVWLAGVVRPDADAGIQTVRPDRRQLWMIGVK